MADKRKVAVMFVAPWPAKYREAMLKHAATLEDKGLRVVYRDPNLYVKKDDLVPNAIQCIVPDPRVYGIAENIKADYEKEKIEVTVKASPKGALPAKGKQDDKE